MDLSRNYKAAIVFMLTSLSLVILDVVSMHANMEWDHALPHWLHAAEPAMINVLTPVVFLIAGLGMLLAWLGRRSGLVVLGVIAAVMALHNILATYYRLEATLFQATVICAAELAANIPVVVYAVKGFRESRTVAAHAGESVRTPAPTP
jgi:hypothetical protein